MQTVVQVLPSLVGLMTAVGVLRASGFLEFLTHILEVPATSIGLPGPIIPIAFIRLVSNSAAVGLVLDLCATGAILCLTVGVLLCCL